MLPGKFDVQKTCDALLREKTDVQDAVSLFMAVPTVYSNLAKHL